jgi:hypothetical protein
MRQRGTSEAVQTADLMLRQLAAVSPEAGKEAQSSLPQPPPIEELFGGTHFGVPDWDAGRRHLETTPIDVTRWTKELKMEVAMPVLLAPVIAAAPAPAPTAEAIPAEPAAAAQTAAVTMAIFHVEVVPTGDSRNLKIRPGTPEDVGYVKFDSGDIPVVYDGKQLVLPAKLTLPAGKYEIHTVDAGKVVSSEELEVKSLSTRTVTVKRP